MSRTPKTKIDTFMMIIADQNGGKSNQIRSIFEGFDLAHQYGGYPTARNIAKKYYVHPDIDLYVRLSSWHEKGKQYPDVKSDLESGYIEFRRRYKVLVPAQVTGTSALVGGENLFIKIVSDFDIRRAYAIWLSPDRSDQRPFGLGEEFAEFMTRHRHISALALDSLALHPSKEPKKNSINERLLSDLLFRT
ncbi:MAG: hypothetical protein KF899_11665 [Parvibaculum sp.]|nr:hypothetical protein [Parvibaculum sp.]